MAIGAVALVLGLAGCGDEGDPGADETASGANAVEAQDFRFAPATVHVPVGATVTWRNTGGTDHTIKGPGFFSRAVAPGARYDHRFAEAGSYDYVCTLHPDSMRGSVVVDP